MVSKSSLRSDCTEFYRLALLLTGDAGAASRVLEEVAAESSGHIDQIRDEKRRAAWFVRRIRERSTGGSAPQGGDASGGTVPEAARGIVRKVHALAEPDRSAVALFYMKRFTAREIAHLLGLRIDDLAGCLDRGRAALGGAEAIPPTTTP